MYTSRSHVKSLKSTRLETLLSGLSPECTVTSARSLASPARVGHGKSMRGASGVVEGAGPIAQATD